MKQSIEQFKRTLKRRTKDKDFNQWCMKKGVQPKQVKAWLNGGDIRLCTLYRLIE